MTSDRTSEPATPLEMGEELLMLVTGVVITAPMLPGFLLCVPVLGALAFAVIIPLAAVGLAFLALGAALAAPVLLFRAARALRPRRRKMPMPVQAMSGALARREPMPSARSRSAGSYAPR